jgi:NADH pyrophosphatase NudC (nudix superfamily)
MDIEKAESNWGKTSETVINALNVWRKQHPKATFREIEAAVDEELGRLRRQMLMDAALVSQAAEWEANSEEAPVCPECGAELESRGKAKRTLTTAYNQPVELEWGYGVCRCVRPGFSPWMKSWN